MERVELDIWSAREVARLLTLVENEKRYYQEVIATLPVPLAVVSREHGILSVNRAFRKAFGLRHAEVVQRRLEDFQPAAELGPVIKRVLDSGSPETSSLMLKGKAYQAAVLPLLDWYDDSRQDALLVLESCSATSVTTEQPEQLPIALWTLAPESGKITKRGMSIERVYGARTAEEWAARVHPDDADRVRGVYRSAMETQQPASVDYRVQNRGGELAWLCDVIQPVGAELHIATLDVTERRRQAAIESQQRKDEALRRVGSRIAHNLNNFLMIINGYAEELQEGLTAGDPRAEGVRQILTAAERMTVFSDELLEFSRPAAPRTQMVDLTALLHRAGLAIPLVAHDASYIAADPVQLIDALRKIIEATAEHQPADPPFSISVSEERALSDYAMGQPAGVSAVLRLGPVAGWNEKEWSDPSLEKNQRASLAHPIAIINQMGGRVALESLPAGTSQICIRFHAVSAPTPPAASPVPAPAEAKSAEPVASLETVLVVDDERSICDLIARILNRQGYRVLGATSSEEALKIAAGYSGGIDLVVSDVMLPDMGGTELVARLRQTRQALRVLYISGYTDDPAITSGTLGPAEGFLQKPFTLVALVSTVRMVLDAPVT